jgi:hypothetical protein
MSIRLLQKENAEYSFWIQKSYKIFGSSCWLTLRDRKELIKVSLIYSLLNFCTLLFFYGLDSYISSDISIIDAIIDAIVRISQMYYSYIIMVWSIIYSLYYTRVSEICDVSYTIPQQLHTKIGNKNISILASDLVKSEKRTFFGNIKVVYYMNKKDLRKQKLEKLKSIFK